VIMLEAGWEVSPAQFLSHKWPYELPYRGLRGEKQAPFSPRDFKAAIRYDNCDHVSMDRVRVLGGRTLHWNAVTLRYAPEDFRQRSTYGVEEDWPLTYDELEPYYDRIEQTIGVCGEDDGLEILSAAHSLAVQRACARPSHKEDGHSAHLGAQGGPDRSL
jgi:choline dehydrogenase-like flavoprotein